MCNNHIQERDERVNNGHFPVCRLRKLIGKVRRQQIVDKPSGYRTQSIPCSLTG